MTMLQTVVQLQAKGHKVEYYIRKDGGILVKSIDGVRYPSGASGNARARELAGTSLSEARGKQLKYATRTRKTYRRKNISLDEQLEREFARVKKKWNKAFKSKEGKPHPAGYFGKSRIKYAIEHYGKEEALRRILEAERYASGLAYSKNVEILGQFIKLAGDDLHSQELLDLAQDVLDNAYTIREEWIYPAYRELYKLDKGVPLKEVVKNTRAILRL